MALTGFDRPERVEVSATNTMMDIDTTYVLTGANGGTWLVVTTDVRPKGRARALSPLLRLFMRRELARKYQTVAQVCARGSGPSSS